MADGPRSAIRARGRQKTRETALLLQSPQRAPERRRSARLPIRPSPPTPAAAGSSSASAGRGTAPKTHRAGRDDSEREPQTPTLGGAASLVPGRRRRQPARWCRETLDEGRDLLTHAAAPRENENATHPAPPHRSRSLG